MASKLIKLGLQCCASGVHQRLPRSLPLENFSLHKFTQAANSYPVRRLSVSNSFRQEEEAEEDEKALKEKSKDRRVLVPVETSIRYMQSKAYKEAYGDKPVWYFYRRNHIGLLPPKPRRKCITKGFLSTGNPCPVCRDEYLVLHYTNIELMQQFISKYSGEPLPIIKIGLCQTQYENLLREFQKAKDHGTFTFDIPFREYQYKDYIPEGLRFH